MLMKFHCQIFTSEQKEAEFSIPMLELLNNYLKTGCTQQLKINRTHISQKPKCKFFFNDTL